MGVSRVSVAGPTLSPLLLMAAASFVAGMVLPAGLFSSKYSQLRDLEQQHRAELVQLRNELDQARLGQAGERQRLQEARRQLSSSEQALKAQQAADAAQAARRAVAPSPAVEQASAAAAASAAALKHEKAVEAQEQHDNDALRRELQELRAKVAKLSRASKVARAAPKTEVAAPVAAPVKPAPPAQAAQHLALAATDAAAVGIRALAPGMVVLANGERVLVGQQFPSGETLLSVDPRTDEVRTNKRTLLLFFKR